MWDRPAQFGLGLLADHTAHAVAPIARSTITNTMVRQVFTYAHPAGRDTRHGPPGAGPSYGCLDRGRSWTMDTVTTTNNARATRTTSHLTPKAPGWLVRW
jgi:hypothetical protein